MKTCVCGSRGLLVIGAACLLSQAAHATLFYEEGFDYAPGHLSGDGSWAGAANGLQVGSTSLTYPGLADTVSPGNSLLVSSGAAGSMTVNFSSTALTSGSIYYSFLLDCATLPTANNYLCDLLPSGGSVNGSSDPLSFYVGQQTAGSTYKIGVRHSGVGSGATYTSGAWATAGTVNLVVVKYTFGSGGAVSLYVNPTLDGSEPLTPDVSVAAGGSEAANLQMIGFKAQSATTAGNWIFDDLRVGDSWSDVVVAVPEPSVVTLASLGLLGLGLRRRSR